MPTARELLEQVDALMRRNRLDPVDDIPVLTDAVSYPAEAPRPATAPAVEQALEMADEDAGDMVPTRTDSVAPQTIKADAIAIEGEPSDWLDFDEVEPSVIGDAPDSIAVVPPVEGRKAPDNALLHPAEYEENELTALLENDVEAEVEAKVEAAVEAEVEAEVEAPTPPRTPPTTPERGDGTRSSADSEEVLAVTASSPTTIEESPHAFVEPMPLADAGKTARDERFSGDKTEDVRVLDVAPATPAPAPHAARAPDVGTEAVPAAHVPAQSQLKDATVTADEAPAVPASAQDDAPDTDTVSSVAPANRPLPEPELIVEAGVASASSPARPTVETPSAAALAATFAAIAPVVAAAPTPAQIAADAAGERAQWDAIAEEIRMQVLQRIDLFTDTGLREQLGARLKPIADRASAEMVVAINLHVGELLRAYVAEAIEREIETWRRDN